MEAANTKLASDYEHKLDEGKFSKTKGKHKDCDCTNTRIVTTIT